MHYRDRPTERPVHTFERVSPTQHAALVAAAFLALAGLSLAAKSSVGHDAYCTRQETGARCVLREHFAARTVERSLEIPADTPSEMARSLRAQLRSYAPIVFDGRFYRDAIDSPVRRGEWTRGWSAYQSAAEAFFEGRDSRALFVRQRIAGAQFSVGGSIALALLGVVTAVGVTLSRRRFRVRFDPNSGNAWTSAGTVFALGPEREVSLGANGALEHRSEHGREQLAVVGSNTVLFDSPNAEDAELFRSLAKGIEKARGPIKTIATPLPRAFYALSGGVTAVFAAAIAVFVVGHASSLPETTGTIELRAETECHYGSMTLMRGGVMSWVTDIGTHELQLTDQRHRAYTARAHVTPGAVTRIQCTASAFEPPPSNL